MIGSTIREVQFRTRFGAAVVAIRRGSAGESLLQSVANVQLRQGDVLLLDAEPDFLTRYGQDKNFLVVSAIAKSAPPQFGKFYIAMLLLIAIFAIFIGSSTAISLIPTGIVAVGIMLVLRILTPQQARGAVDWEVLVTIAAAGGLSAAMENSGLAAAIASGMMNLSIATGGGAGGVIAAMYIGTVLVSLVVANNAAALIMFSIGASAIVEYNIDPYMMFYTIMLGASASFCIPYGYQTNIISLSLGPYTFVEFSKFGVGLQLVLVPISILLVLYMYQWVYGVVISTILFLITVVYKLAWGTQIPLTMEAQRNKLQRENQHHGDECAPDVPSSFMPQQQHRQPEQQPPPQEKTATGATTVI